MKHFLLSGLLIIGGPVAGFGAQKTLTGQISDAMCGADHSMMQHGTAKPNARKCTQACVKTGQAYVLVSNGHVYHITNQDFAGLAKYAGESVRATGELGGDNKSITISKLALGK